MIRAAGFEDGQRGQEPRNVEDHWQLGKGKETDPPLRTFRREQPGQHLDFDLIKLISDF